MTNHTMAFFDEMLPEALYANRALFNVLRGSISIAVQEEGAWTIRFGKYGEGCYTGGLDESADCIMIWEKAAFEKMLLQEGLSEEEEPQCYGDPKMIGVFMKMLQDPSRGQLGVRAANF